MRCPTEFGGYLLLERINVGGMAEVFRAKSFGIEGFERIVAVKRILPALAVDEEFVRMFVDEAQIAAKLTHQNIVQIYDLRDDPETGSFFISMEYVAGKDLRAILDALRKQSRPMDLPQACFILSCVAEALEYAHQKRGETGKPLQIIHRDVTPQNVLVSYEGEVKLCDFGIAKAAIRASRTQAGVLKGKFAYMSPEQVRGEPTDRRSDLFALGVIFYEMLTGERLFLCESDYGTLEAIRITQVPPPRRFNPSVSPALEEVVMKLLAKSPRDRYQSASELHEDLADHLVDGGRVYHGRHLRAWMRTTFAADLDADDAKVEGFMRLGLPGRDRRSRNASGSSLAPLPASVLALAQDQHRHARGLEGLAWSPSQRPQPPVPSAARAPHSPSAPSERAKDGLSPPPPILRPAPSESSPVARRFGVPRLGEAHLDAGAAGDENQASPLITRIDASAGSSFDALSGMPSEAEAQGEADGTEATQFDVVAPGPALWPESPPQVMASGDHAQPLGPVDVHPGGLGAPSDQARSLGHHWDTTTQEVSIEAAMPPTVPRRSAPTAERTPSAWASQGVGLASIEDNALELPTRITSFDDGEATSESLPLTSKPIEPRIAQGYVPPPSDPGQGTARWPGGEHDPGDPQPPLASWPEPARPRERSSLAFPRLLRFGADLQRQMRALRHHRWGAHSGLLGALASFTKRAPDPRAVAAVALAMGTVALGLLLVLLLARPSGASLRILVEPPGAVDVYVDGALVGQRTPVDLVGLALGLHTIELERPGYRRYTQAIEILETRPHTMVVPLERAAAGPEPSDEGPDAKVVSPVSARLTAAAPGDAPRPPGADATTDTQDPRPSSTRHAHGPASSVVRTEARGAGGPAGPTESARLQGADERGTGALTGPPAETDAAEGASGVRGAQGDGVDVRAPERVGRAPRQDPERAEPEARGLPSTDGFLVVATRPPGILVVINGQSTKLRTPVRNGIPLPAGEHQVAFDLGTGRRYEFTVEIEAGRTTRLEKQLR